MPGVASLKRLSPMDGDGKLRVVLESPQGSRHKLKYEPAEHAFRVDDAAGRDVARRLLDEPATASGDR